MSPAPSVYYLTEDIWGRKDGRLGEPQADNYRQEKISNLTEFITTHSKVVKASPNIFQRFCKF